MVARIAARNAMIAAGVVDLLEVFVGLNKGFGILKGVLRMHVIVACAVANEQCTLQTGGTFYRVYGISVGVFLGCLHVTLGIYRVVMLPIGGRSHGHTGPEHAPSLAHTHQCVEPTEAPAPDANAVFVYKRLLSEPQSGLYLILRLQISQAQIDTFLELRATTARATTVYTHHHKALLRQVMVE